MAEQIRIYLPDPIDPEKAEERVVSITPIWWDGGPSTFVDGADIMRAIEEMVNDETAAAHILCDTVAVRVGMKSVVIYVAVSEFTTDAAIESGRAMIVEKLDALAEGNLRRQCIIATRNEIAEERHQQASTQGASTLAGASIRRDRR